jgi:micrococcal nuclease
MSKKALNGRLILIGLLLLSLSGCSSGVKLIEKEVEIYEGQTINPLDYLSEDYKDDSNVIIENNVDTSKAGDYEIIYKIKDNKTTLKVKVLGDPITLTQQNISLETGSDFDLSDYISEEDRSNDISITDNVDINKKGEYIVIYSFAGLTKELNVTVKEVELILKQTSLVIDLESTFDPRSFIDGGFSQSPKITILNPVNTSVIGKYSVKYTLGKISKTLSVTVKDVSPILTKTSVSIKQGSTFDPIDYLISSDKTNASIVIDNNVDTDIPGTYSVSYTLDTIVKTLSVTVTEVEAEVPYSIEVISLTSPVNAGSNATIVIQGKAGKEYSIEVYYKSGASTADGLENKTANSSGRVTWTWKVGSRTSAGSWEIVISDDENTISTYITVN